ncbi:MAG: hypothetical protein GX117_00245 [Candidatus Hydrogenedentes bacterium]|jgi:hypothetical protein|nr:hypothetical protein [Candidatus Hydrogenedentota bacterium]
MNTTKSVAHLFIVLLLLLSSSTLFADFFVAPDGADDNPGTEQAPFRSLEKARDAIRALKKEAGLPDGGVTVHIAGGTYEQRRTFVLTAEDSGTAAAPIRYCAFGAEAPCFTGALPLRNFRAVDDPEILARLPESAREHIRCADLAEAGLDEVPALLLGGFSSGRGFVTHPIMELFVEDVPMIPARWPNEGFIFTGEIQGDTVQAAKDEADTPKDGIFKFLEERPLSWVNEPDPWLYGYWYWDWADSYEKIASIDAENRIIRLEKPWHGYGYRAKQRYYALNLLCELDMPGEWYLDRAEKKLYLYPKQDLEGARVSLSAALFSMVHATDLAYLSFEGIQWECGAADGILLEGGTACRLEGCVIRKMAGNGLEINGGFEHHVQSCDIYSMGRGGIVLSGGDRKSLRPGKHRVENCHIHHLSRIDHCYTPGVLLSGVGNEIRHCFIHDVASSAFRVGGNDHLLEFNEIYRAVLESDDQGGADMWGDPTYYGNVYRYNYWHHLGNPKKDKEDAHSMQAGIRLDDAICGVVIEGNIFQRCSMAPTVFGGVQIHGGKDNLITGNLFVDNAAAVSFSPWGEKRWHAFVADALDAEEIDRALYLERYPALAKLLDDHDFNRVENNVVLRCDQLFLRAPDVIQSRGNRELPDSGFMRESAEERLHWSESEAAELGLQHIPFEKIGLYKDRWRSEVVRAGN